MYIYPYVDKNKNKKKSVYLLQADFSVSSSGETYWAVPTNELALADEKRKMVMLRYKTLKIVDVHIRTSWLTWA